MVCVAGEDRLVEYVDGSLSETDRHAIEGHLQECPSCRAEAEQLARTHARLLRDGQADPAPSLAVAVIDRILRSETPKPRRTMWRTVMAHKYATIGVAAGLCLVAATITLVFANRPPDKPSDALAQGPATPPGDTPAQPLSGGNVAHKPGPTDPRLANETRSERVGPVKEWVAKAEVIVVATFADSAPAQPRRVGDAAETLMRFRVDRIMKGDLADEVITIQHPSPAVGVDVNDFAGKEWILLLSPEFMAGKHRYAGIATIKLECEVRAILALPATPPGDTPAQPAGGGNVAHKPGLADGRPATQRVERMSERTDAERVPEAAVIVVATFVDSAPAQPRRPGDAAETLMRFRVDRILKGKLDQKVITIQEPNPPVGAGVNKLAGKEWILLLSPEYMAGKHRYAGRFTVKLEKEIRAILALPAGPEGAPKTPATGPATRPATQPASVPAS
jgi:hypothetical protein